MTGPTDPPCPLCGRPLPAESRSLHHLVPKSLKGRETVTLHRICHRKIHALFSERELQKRYHDLERLKAHPEIRKFVGWLANKDPNFYARTENSRGRRR